jgi:hypothetical protein
MKYHEFAMDEVVLMKILWTKISGMKSWTFME